MEENVALTLTEAYHEAFKQIPENKISLAIHELNWQGKAQKSFQNWFFTTFSKHRSQKFIINQAKILKLQKEDWRLCRDIAKMAFACMPNYQVNIKTLS